ncbi:STAS/SEC14 domain-containing protein [Pseudohalocynthiibacter aestuariivivens]|nr:STAS/SEC14 domain-containing protein [Pseudohalocynthiibacter aestuariivivens]QIE44059.1 STAS/SEC14 domain-containing protein [Pseudohalocynthiibacter aestuariivivens]
MFDLKQQDNLLIVTVSGKVTADEVTAFYGRFNDIIADIDRIGMVIDVTGFDDMTGDAIARDIPLELGLVDQMGKFPKAAVVSDKEFIAAAAHALNPLVPVIDIRVFRANDIQAAKEFATDLPPKKPKGKGIYMMDKSTPEVMAFEIDGYMDDDEMETVSKDVLARLESDKEFSALVKIKSFGGFDPGILTQGSFYQMKFGSIKNLKKYAIVTDETWMKPLLGFAGSVSGVEMKRFSLAEEQAAWDWVRS